MEEAGDDIVADYRGLVGFYKWFDGAIRRRNQPTLDELDARSAEIADALRQAWGPVVQDTADVPTDS
jgi:hypothetical protein